MITLIQHNVPACVMVCSFSSNMTDYEDAVMLETALRSGCDYIVTRNLKDYKNVSIPAYSPSDFLQYITPTEE